ncbi:cupin domain-containing protein [Jiangella asiatica]|uniref:Cupin type-2 domain-containing protein n=1 Tax=Jiangella asiatica TaxID=2530372 RepID=A0A4R5D8U3_9ACTN|nr:cupin domain-containing protein [Jiangella asiatica]TDE09926.1 hypothetical protein E1269_13205 [Jiangella asiatica]
MPVFRDDLRGRPDWCELERFEIATLPPGGEHRWAAAHPANKLVVVEGRCTVGEKAVERGGTLDVPAGDHTVRSDDEATVVLLGGHWGEDCGGAGLFGVAKAEELGDIGDPASYPKETNFDRHYHDCDEYWIVLRGGGTASSEDVLYEVGPGDCVATRMGSHHDFPLVTDPVLAVFFETTMRGELRRGHLWEHTHGPAVAAK